MKLPKQQIAAVLEKAGIRQNARAEEMTMQDFAAITVYISEEEK